MTAPTAPSLPHLVIVRADGYRTRETTLAFPRGVAQTIGGNPNKIELRLERCGCGSTKIPASLVLHEVGHALGFFHVADRNAVMYPFITGECRQRAITAIEQMHVNVAYSRPRGTWIPIAILRAFSCLPRH